MIRRIMEEYMLKSAARRGYELVYTPHVAKVDLWQLAATGLLHEEHVSADGVGRRSIG